MSAAKEDSLEPTGSKSKDVQKKSSKNRPLEAKNRTSLPAGLALMHGFSAKNVGKQRITVNSTLNAMGGVCLIIAARTSSFCGRIQQRACLWETECNFQKATKRYAFVCLCLC